MTEDNKAWKIEEFKQCLEVVETEKQCFSCSNKIPAEYQALNMLGMKNGQESYACLLCCNNHLDDRLTRFLEENQVKELQKQRVAEEL